MTMTVAQITASLATLAPPFDPRTAASRVTAGAAYLDTVRPGWHDDVNLDHLDVATATDCVLGQLYGNYPNAPLFDGITRPNLLPVRGRGSWMVFDHDALNTYRRQLDERAVPYGFAAEAVSAEYPALNAAWRSEILARRERITVTPVTTRFEPAWELVDA